MRRHRKHPYLLRGITVDRPAGSSLVRRHHLHSVATRLRLPRGESWTGTPGRCCRWRISNTLDGPRSASKPSRKPCTVAGCCSGDLQHRSGLPVYQRGWIGRSEQDRSAFVSMDGKGRWMDNVFIERLWRSLKCEEVYLKDYREPGRTGGRGWNAWMERLQPPSDPSGSGLPASLGPLPAELRSLPKRRDHDEINDRKVAHNPPRAPTSCKHPFLPGTRGSWTTFLQGRNQTEHEYTQPSGPSAAQLRTARLWLRWGDHFREGNERDSHYTEKREGGLLRPPSRASPAQGRIAFEPEDVLESREGMEVGFLGITTHQFHEDRPVRLQDHGSVQVR